MNPGMPPAPRGPAVELTFSHGARMAIPLVIAAVSFLLSILVVVASWPDDPEPMVLSSCNVNLDGPMGCRDAMTATGMKMAWRVKEAGTYKLTVARNGGPVRVLRVEKAAGGVLQTNSGTPGPDTVISIKLTPGEYRVQVADATPTPASVGKPFSLVVEQVGVKLPERHFRFHVGLLVFPVFGLIFLGVALAISGEKKRTPLRIDGTGVTMRDGRKLPWSEYRGTQAIMWHRRSRGPVESGTKLLFPGHEVEIHYRSVTNIREVAPLIEALKMRLNPWA